MRKRVSILSHRVSFNPVKVQLEDDGKTSILRYYLFRVSLALMINIRSLFLILMFYWVALGTSYAQQELEAVSRSTSSAFIVKGSILDTETMAPVSKANVEVRGGAYTTSSKDGEFRIKARVGDELVIRSSSFETVYYTIKDAQRLHIQVIPNKESYNTSTQDTEAQRSFQDKIQGAKNVYKQQAARGIDLVAQALSLQDITLSERAQCYKILGDIYSYWKQYDLAVTNYASSLELEPSISVEIALAQAYYKNKNYQESIALFITLSRKRLSDTQKIKVQEGLGDARAATGDYVTSVTNYTAAEKQAIRQNQVATAARLKTKIGESYEQQGAPAAAVGYFDEAIQLSKEAEAETSVRAKTTVADYYSRNGSYGEEIALRKAALQDFKNVQSDSITNDDAITAQKQNYKIGFAYAAQNKLDEAIPFLEKSVAEARTKEDLIIEKNARRRLSEVYRDKGNFTKAAENYEAYKKVVDLSYNRKEQEISQATRFAKEIAEKQNRILSLEKDRELNMSRFQLAFQEQELAAVRDTRQKIMIGSLAIVAILLLVTAFTMYRSTKQQKYANNLLALKSLRSQMNPHFIFNALNSVNSFIALNDERTANRYLSDFSLLMRAVLENSEENLIPLSKEIDLINRYVMLEHFRFKDKFEYEVTVDEQLDVEAYMIPPMLLQPYVENAVWHGLRYMDEKGKLEIHFAQRDIHTAIVTVTDNGVGRKRSKDLKTAHQKKQKSQGMSTIKKRIAILNEMYGERIAVDVQDNTEARSGTIVTLTLKKV